MGNSLLPAPPAGRRFRLGVPSYVLPADILPNVEALAGGVDDIELVLFESGRKSLPGPRTVRRLAEIAGARSLSYTIHLPIDLKLGSESRAERAEMLRSIRAIMRRARPLKPFAWILHLDGISPRAGAGEVVAWRGRVERALGPVADISEDPARLCVENLLYPFEWCADLVESFNLGVCVDIGHALLARTDLREHFRRFGPRIRVVHLHAAAGGRDHLGLDKMDAARLRECAGLLRGFRGVMTLEMFNLHAVISSIRRLGDFLSS